MKYCNKAPYVWGGNSLSTGAELRGIIRVPGVYAGDKPAEEVQLAVYLQD